MSQTITGTQAESTYAFINSIGVDVHLSYYNTAYDNESAVLADLQYLGVDHVRDAAPITTDHDYWTPFETDMAAGIKFDFVIPQNEMNIAAITADLNALEIKDPGGISAIEGINEGSSSASFDGLTGDAAINAFQAALMTAVQNDPLLAGVSVYGYTLDTYDATDFTQFGNISDESTDGNAHLYYGYLPPQSAISWYLPLQIAGTPNDPFVITETGYDTMPGEDRGSQGVNDDVQAKYTLDDVFDLLKSGARLVDIYELLDEMPDPNMTDHEQHFGLFNNDGTSKEDAVALHNLTTIVADNGANAATFAAGSLAYTLSGLPSSGNSTLLEKSNGSFYLSVWAEPEIWNPTTLTEITVAATPVTVTLAQIAKSVEVYDPLVGTTPIATYTDVSQVTLGITDHPLIVEIDPVTDPILSGVVTLTGAAEAGVLVSLLSTAGKVLATATTNSAGDFTFTGMAVGSYKVKYTAPSGQVFQLGSEANATTGITPVIALATNQAVTLATEQLLSNPGTIKAAVLHYGAPTDNSWGTGQGGVTVSLLNAAGTVIATTVSPSWGGFSFTDIGPGTYQLKYAAPAGQGFLPAGPENATTGLTAKFTVAAGQTVSAPQGWLMTTIVMNGTNLTDVAPAGAYLVTGNASNSTLTLGTGAQFVTLTGGGDTVIASSGGGRITLAGNNNAVSIGLGHKTINAGSGRDTVHAAGGNIIINATGAGNLFDSGPGLAFLNADGSANNVFMLNPAVGHSRAMTTITGFNPAANDILDLKRTLAGISILPDLSQVGSFVTAAFSGANTVLYAAPTGGGTPMAFATLDGIHVTVAQLQAAHELSIN